MEEAFSGNVTIYGGKSFKYRLVFFSFAVILLVYILTKLKRGDIFAKRQQRNKEKILTWRMRPSFGAGYKKFFTVSQIVDEAGVARGKLFESVSTKDRILLELTWETMFGGQFGVARSIADSKPPPVYAYAVETAIRAWTLTELNENPREISIEAYSARHIGIYLFAYYGRAEADFWREFSR